MSDIATDKNFVHVLSLPLAEIRTVEVFTDGYPKAPDGTSIDDWERAFRDAIRQDPHRCQTFPATKLRDDRTVVVATIDS